MPIDLDELQNRTTRQSVLVGHGLDVVNMHGSDFDALIAELRTLRARVADAEAVRHSLNEMVRVLDGSVNEVDADFDAEAIERVLGTAAWNDQLTVVKADTVRYWMAKIEGLRRTIKAQVGELRAARDAQSKAEEDVESLRARVAEMERDLDACRVDLVEAQHTVEEPPAEEYAWYYEGGSIQGDGYESREDAIEHAITGYEADPERIRVGPMRAVDGGSLVDAEGWIDDIVPSEASRLFDVKRLVERAEEWHAENVEDGCVFLAHPFSQAEATLRAWVDEYVTFSLMPGAQEALEEWARDNLSPDPSLFCEGTRLDAEEMQVARAMERAR